ncbi:MFS transporter [Paraflavitalea soli]|uniref:MFS transporter n=1 Tax=Paraflavitalea soli TaxID=2315862 RepID=A0A3B7MJD4_9BACT|nr:MFS transporter [Paraflavitalea soli]AXY73339.1 MFS transporter [Paraflavitalea soli]
MAGDPESVSPKKARIAIAVFFFVSGFGFASWASRILTIQQHLHLDDAQLGAALFAMPAGLMLTLPLTGFLLRRFSSRYVMLGGALLFNMMLCLVGFVDQTWQFVAVLFFFGSARNLFNISANAQSIGVQAMYSKSIIANLHGIWSTAGFAAAAIGTLMVSAKIATSWHFLGASILLTSLCCYFFKDSIHQLPSPHERKGSFVWPDRTMLKFGLIAFASMACEGTMYDWAAIYLRKATGAHDGIATAGYAIYMVSMTLGRFTGDRMANKIGIKNMLRYSGTLMFSGLLLATLVPNTYVAAVGFIMVGFGVSCVVPMTFSMAGKVKNMSGGPAIAAVSTVGYLGFLIVPPVVGFIAKAINIRLSFAIMSLLGLLILWMVGKFSEKHQA